MTADGASLLEGTDGLRRCWWCVGDPLYEQYHDSEWGVPILDDRHVFEHICLEGFQAGLSWITILRRREHFQAAFANFEPQRVARFNKRSVARLMDNAGIIRNRAKIKSAINNAKLALELIDEYGSIAAFLWRYEPRQRRSRITRKSMPVTSPESVAMSKDLKKLGWTFVGPTGLYALMQAIGVVNDHVTGCDIRSKVEEKRRRLVRPTIRY